MYKDKREFFHTTGNNIERFCIRQLKYEDIEKIALARKMQETENGNGASKAYILEYKKILKKLFDENKIIGAGAFLDEDLISLAFYNLISYGKENKLPYLCGVWTHPEHRQKGLALEVYKKLTEGAYERKGELQTDSLVTIEGDEAALNLYQKLGYRLINNEMTFLGDVKSPKGNYEVVKLDKKDNIETEVFLTNKNLKMIIQYSPEQFFSHPFNMNGSMSRIKRIRFLDNNINYEEFKMYMQKFFSKHRFCKFNIQELMEKDKLGQLFNISNKQVSDLILALEKMRFEGTNGEEVNLKISNNVMQKNIIRDFEYLDRCIYENR